MAASPTRRSGARGNRPGRACALAVAGALAAVIALAGGCSDEAPSDALPAGSDAWPSVNHDRSNSRSNGAESKLSRANASELAPRWRLEGLAGTTSTPAVVDDTVYFGDWDGVFRAVRSSDGGEIWSRKLGMRIDGSALVDGDRVYVAELGGTLFALDRASGETLWTAELDSDPTTSIDSSPVLAGRTIVIGVSSYETAIALPDYTFRGSIVGLDADDGRELWRVYTTANDATSGAGVSVWSSAAVDERRGLVFIGTGQTYEQPASPMGDSVVAIRYETGDVAWVHQFTKDDVFTIPAGGPGPDADVGASPNLFAIAGRDVVGVGDKGGTYHVLDRDTGEAVWETSVCRGSPLGGIMVTAAVADGAIFVGCNRWRAFGFVTTGRHNPNDTSSTFALDARDGSVRWETAMAAPMFGAITVANGVVYHGTIDGVIHALAADDGAELWSDHPGGDVAAGIAVAGGTVYVGRGFWFFTQPPMPNGGLVAYSAP
ncbi:MAG TPA: PQQ-binding-like beta-propeller repeat protein [Candidatus Binatia bacterium]|nr:PQQ-binding-like beta-propeller repeat protein [Candidatus Binatia bacterium]